MIFLLDRYSHTNCVSVYCGWPCRGVLSLLFSDNLSNVVMHACHHEINKILSFNMLQSVVIVSFLKNHCVFLFRFLFGTRSPLYDIPMAVTLARLCS